MELEQVDSTVLEDEPVGTTNRARRFFFALIAVLVLIVGVWLLVRPGVFTIQPIGALPEGITVVYHSRGSQMPFFASPDGLCLELMGGVSLLCRMTAIGVVEDISDRIIVRLPYSEFAYLLSTDGATFDR